MLSAFGTFDDEMVFVSLRFHTSEIRGPNNLKAIESERLNGKARTLARCFRRGRDGRSLSPDSGVLFRQSCR